MHGQVKGIRNYGASQKSPFQRFSLLKNPLNFKDQDFNFIAFGGGQRGCPGLSLGVMLVEYVLANLLCWFDWKFPSGIGREDDLDMSEVSRVVIHKKIPLQLVLVFRTPSSK
ncbi:hypothetical protein ACSBR1_011909 [Camellia fascicularis]